MNVFLTLLLIGTISGIIIGATFFNYVKTYLIDEDYDIENLKTSLDQTTTIWYKNENGEYVELEDQRIYGTENRSWVSYSEMPQNLVNAFVAIEDERFWQHNGVDWKRTFGAVLEFVSGNDSYGGSTITQQLIKNISGEDDTTIQRKVTEIFRALSLSEKRSRYEIFGNVPKHHKSFKKQLRCPGCGKLLFWKRCFRAYACGMCGSCGYSEVSD